MNDLLVFRNTTNEPQHWSLRVSRGDVLITDPGNLIKVRAKFRYGIRDMEGYYWGFNHPMIFVSEIEYGDEIEVSTLNETHDAAMDLADQGDSAMRKGQIDAATEFYKQAYELERGVAENANLQPSYSVMWLSAAALALQACLWVEARHCALMGMEKDPDNRVREELYAIYEEVAFSGAFQKIKLLMRIQRQIDRKQQRLDRVNKDLERVNNDQSSVGWPITGGANRKGLDKKVELHRSKLIRLSLEQRDIQKELHYLQAKLNWIAHGKDDKATAKIRFAAWQLSSLQKLKPGDTITLNTGEKVVIKKVNTKSVKITTGERVSMNDIQFSAKE